MAQWTRQRILRAILHREATGLSLAAGGKEAVDSALYQAAYRIFGSWRNAIMAAGIAPEQGRVRNGWSPARIQSTIRALSRRKRPLPAGEFKRQYGSLMQAARRQFGSWSKAVVAAGVDPTKLRRMPSWTKERIIEEILTRALHNQPLVRRSVEPRSLADASTRFFGSWRAALIAAGLDPDECQGNVRRRNDA